MKFPAFKILIVDDVEANRVLLADSMFALGHDPQTAENGRIALDKMRTSEPDMVLLDILMPVMDGYNTLLQMKADENLRHIPVVVISAVDELENVVKCIAAGADDYLAKPFNATLLKARIGACLDRKRLHDQEEAHRRQLEGANERIHQQNEELIQVNALKDKFLQIASHDIRNPLTIVNACLYSLRKQLGAAADDKQSDTLATMERAVSRIGGIVNDFLDFREISEGRCTVEPQQFDLNEIVSAIVAENQEYAGHKQISLRFESAGAALPCLADVNRAAQIASNYVSNALKFTPQGGQVIARTIQRNGMARAEVHDTGAGVLLEERPMLFREFVKLSNRPTGDEKSTGLGLSIVKQLAELQGGSVGAEFPSSGGSVFWFELPAVQD